MYLSLPRPAEAWVSQWVGVICVGELRSVRQKCRILSLAAMAVSIFSGAPAVIAADLGGDCCADLEERVAELEETTARKGNRKVTLTISGYVTKQIMFWDDGAESNAYISDIGPTQATNFRLIGEATIAPGWKAGYVLRIQDLDGNSMGLNQSTPVVNLGLNTQMSYWYLASKDLGKISIGKNALAAKSAAMFTDLSGTQLVSPTTCCSTEGSSSCAAMARSSNQPPAS